jgi:hypothetical protein
MSRCAVALVISTCSRDKVPAVAAQKYAKVSHRKPNEILFFCRDPVQFSRKIFLTELIEKALAGYDATLAILLKYTQISRPFARS